MTGAPKCRMTKTYRTAVPVTVRAPFVLQLGIVIGISLFSSHMACAAGDMALAQALESALRMPKPLPRVPPHQHDAALPDASSQATLSEPVTSRRQSPPLPIEPAIKLSSLSRHPPGAADPSATKQVVRTGPAPKSILAYMPFAVAIRQAMGHILSVIAATDKVRAADATLHESQAAFLPHFSLSAQAQQYVNQSGQAGSTVIGSSVLFTQGNIYSHGISLIGSLNLFDGGGDTAELAASRNRLTQRREDFDAEQVRAAMAALLAYGKLRDAQREVQLQSSILRIREQQLSLAKIRYENGAGSLISVSQRDAARSRSVLALFQAHRNLIDRSADLAEATAFSLGPDEVLQAVDPIPAAPGHTATVADDLIDTLPQVLAAEAAVSAAQADVDKARAAYLPRVNLTASYNWLGSTGQSDFSDVLGHTRPNNYTVELNLTQALFPLATRNADVDRALAALSTAKAELRDVRVHVRARLARFAAEYSRADEARMATDHARSNANDNLALARALFQHGRIDRSDLDDARIEYLRADAQAREAQGAWSSAQWLLLAMQSRTLALNQLDTLSQAPAVEDSASAHIMDSHRGRPVDE